MPVLENLKIMPLSEAQEDQVRDLAFKTFSEHKLALPHIFASFEEVHREIYDEVFRKSATSSHQAYAALNGEKFAGYVLLEEIKFRADQTPSTAQIFDICVAPAFRGMGVGRALMEHCKELQKQRGWDSLEATVWLGNTISHQLFTSSGYAAERTLYRFGTPSAPVPSPKVASSLRIWTIPLLLLAFGAALAFFTK